MMTISKQNTEDMRAEYDFDYSKAVRGKHARHLLAKGANIVVLEPDVRKIFPSSESVNDALRSLISIIPAVSKSRGLGKSRKHATAGK